MNVLLMLIGVIIVYFVVKKVFRDNWSKELHAEIAFENSHVVKGEKATLVEVITNDKKLPLPLINLKFQADRDLIFSKEDTNSAVSDKVYRNDVFSLLWNQRITRRIPVLMNRRGVFKIDRLEVSFAGMFMDEINVLQIPSQCNITVFPKATPVRELEMMNRMIQGEVERKKYLFEDPFVFKGIREYDSHDSMKNVNWKATAKTGNLMVNDFNESMSRNVCILLNLDSEGALRYDQISEEAISLAAGFAQSIIEKGISVSLLSNGCDYDTKGQTIVAPGAGISHLNEINTALARIDLNNSMEDYAEFIDREIIKKDTHNESSVYVIISADRRGKLIDKFETITRNQNQTIWLIPCFPGTELDKVESNIKPIKWEIR